MVGKGRFSQYIVWIAGACPTKIHYILYVWWGPFSRNLWSVLGKKSSAHRCFPMGAAVVVYFHQPADDATSVLGQPLVGVASTGQGRTFVWFRGYSPLGRMSRTHFRHRLLIVSSFATTVAP